jgi:hypothetical protein
MKNTQPMLIQIINFIIIMDQKTIKWPRAAPGKSMTAHAEELELSYFQLSGFVAQEILGFRAGLGEPIVQLLSQTLGGLGTAVC